MVLLRITHCISVASLDKASVREEVGRLKEDFDHLGAEGKISAEIRAIMNSLFMIIELILAIFLERNTKKDSKNSSKPSSQTEKPRQRKMNQR